MSWLVYILECADNTFYTGITNDIDKRIKTHNSGKGSKYVKTRLPVKLLKYWPADNRSEASKLEYKIKQLSKQQKISLIKGDLNIEDI